jgi:DNA invertase Pin-like site-specific DNA recombinase
MTSAFTASPRSIYNELVCNILLATLSSLAKLKHEKISQRTKAGLARARAMGKVLGRPNSAMATGRNCAQPSMAAKAGMP